MKNSIAQVIVGLPLEGHFDYFVGEDMRSTIRVGHRVQILFNRRKRLGFVCGLVDHSAFKRLNPILAILDSDPVVDAKVIKLTQEFSAYYGCSRGEAIEAYLPTALRQMKYHAIPASPPISEPAFDSVGLIHDAGQQKRWPVLIDKINATLAQKKGVIFLVPEVADMEIVHERLKSVAPAIVELDKQLTPAKELARWTNIHRGEAQIVIGTRSAVFAPLPNLGLIIIYEEEHSAYKQEQTPHYHVHQVAEMRRRIEGCAVCLVSTTPSAEIWYKAKKEKWPVTVLEDDRVGRMKIIDMGNYNPQRSSIISFPLQAVIQKIIDGGGKVVIFVNRSGFEQTMQETMLTMKNKLERLFPGARVGYYFKESTAFPDGANIIVATQAIFRMKQHLSVDVIAMIRFDTEISRLDFRSAEHMFALLIHLRQLAKDQLIVQTRMMDNYCLKAAVRMDFKGFYRNELKFRQQLGFPPFRHLVMVGIRGQNADSIKEYAQNLYSQLTDAKIKSIEIDEPHISEFKKGRNPHKATIILKGKTVKPILKLVKKSLAQTRRKGQLITTINVDPY